MCGFELFDRRSYIEDHLDFYLDHTLEMLKDEIRGSIGSKCVKKKR